MTEQYRGGRKGKKQGERGGENKAAPRLCYVWSTVWEREKNPGNVLLQNCEQTHYD